MLKTAATVKTGVLRQTGAFILSAAGGFCLAGTDIAGDASFLNISLAGALGLPLSAAAFIGSLLRYIADGSVARSMVQIAAMIICLISKLFFESENDPKYSGITTAAAVFISGAAVSAIVGDLLYKLVFYIFYGAVSGFSAYCLAVIAASLNRRLVLDLSAPLSCAYAVIYTLVTASLCSVKVPYINIGIIMGTAVTVTAAYHYRCSGGVICGALTMCGAFLVSSDFGMPIIMMPAAGLLTGYLYKQKAGTAAGFFIGISFALAVFSGITADSVYRLLDIIFGTVIFLVITPNFSDKWVLAGGKDEAAAELIGSRLGFLAGSIETVRRESGRIAEVLARNAEKPCDLEINGGKICENCHRRLSCWYGDIENTRRGFRKMSSLVEISRENFPYELADCLHKEELTAAFEKSAREKMTAKLLSLRFYDSQKLLFEQIRITEELIEAAGERLDLRYSEPVSKGILARLEKYGYKAKKAAACYNSRNRLLAEIYFDVEDAPENCLRICDLIADELRISLDYIEPVRSEREVRIRLFETPPYALEAYGASVCAGHSQETGDTSAVFSDGTGISYVVLSDGMGSGREASLESKMVVSLFRRLVSSGVNYSSAIKLINSIMLAKSDEEAFATLDAVRIDLDTCGLTVIKSGASATLIRHGGQVMKIASPTFPIGIIQEADTFAREYDFDENDIAIMFSDGISENEYKFIKELLLSSDDLKFIVEEICAKAELFNPCVRSDDVTVIGLRVHRSEKSKI